MELEVIKNKIYEIRGQRVMLDRDLAQLYGVETKVLNQAVRRNLERFPEDMQKELDDIYLALSQLAAKQKDTDAGKNMAKIGFKK